ncbi:hypothetical protein A5881_002970 [Enterococcus termitis]|nr:hypothetical protein A5881_002373 [Enterococcus termitis]
MTDRLYNCESCGGKTHLVQKFEKISEDIQRHFFECERCGYKVTIYFSDESLRKKIKKQQKIKDQVTKNSMQKIIEKRMSELRERYEPAI